MDTTPWQSRYKNMTTPAYELRQLQFDLANGSWRSLASTPHKLRPHLSAVNQPFDRAQYRNGSPDLWSSVAVPRELRVTTEVQFLLWMPRRSRTILAVYPPVICDMRDIIIRATVQLRPQTSYSIETRNITF